MRLISGIMGKKGNSRFSIYWDGKELTAVNMRTGETTTDFKSFSNHNEINILLKKLKAPKTTPNFLNGAIGCLNGAISNLKKCGVDCKDLIAFNEELKITKAVIKNV